MGTSKRSMNVFDSRKAIILLLFPSLGHAPALRGCWCWRWRCSTRTSRCGREDVFCRWTTGGCNQLGRRIRRGRNGFSTWCYRSMLPVAVACLCRFCRRRRFRGKNSRIIARIRPCILWSFHDGTAPSPVIAMSVSRATRRMLPCSSTMFIIDGF